MSSMVSKALHDLASGHPSPWSVLVTPFSVRSITKVSFLVFGREALSLPIALVSADP